MTGVGRSAQGRALGRSVVSLVVDAAREAIADAGLAVDDVDAMVVESSYVSKVAPQDEVAAELGHGRSFLSLATGIGGAGVVSTLAAAELLIATGRHRHVLCYFGSGFGSSTGGPYDFPVGLDAKRNYEAPHGWFGQPLYFAAMAERYAVEFGLAPEALAAVAVAAREGALRTDDAVLRRPLTLDSYRDEPQIVGRFRRADCSVISDGAFAWVVSAADRAADGPQPAVSILGCGQASEPGMSSSTYWTQRRRFTTTPCRESAAQAFAAAGLTPADVDVAQIYDCFSISTILQLEDAGFCAKGEGADFVASGALGLTGSLPTNTHGGLLAHSFTVGAGHLVEAVLQLRGQATGRQVEGAEIAYLAGLGLPEHASAVLGRP